MEQTKMRCHFSIIFEKTGRFLVFWFILALGNIDELIDSFTSPDVAPYAFYSCLVLVLLLLLVMGYQFFIWRKTFIYIDGDTFVIERNTLTQKKNTFSLSNIANITLEQNLFERIIGTYCLKLDTDSFSTANSTDVSIVLSAEKANQLRSDLLHLMKKDTVPIDAQAPEASKEPVVSCASMGEVLSHCFFSISTALLFFALAVIAGIPLLFHFVDNSFWEIISEEAFGSSSSFLGIFFLIITYGYSLIKQLLSIYQFCCFRQGNDLIIRYGFFRKQDFTVPIDRINAIQLLQPPLARLTGRIQARLICVGVGDSENETPQFTLCMKKKEFLAHLQEILPEFSTESVQEVRKLPKGAGITYLISSILFLAVFTACFWFGASYIVESRSGQLAAPIIYGIITFLIILYRVLHYFSMGTYLGTEQLVIHSGAFQKQTWLIPYRKIQYVEFTQNPLQRLYNIKKGDIYILASLGNNLLSLSPIHQKDALELQKKLLP